MKGGWKFYRPVYHRAIDRKEFKGQYAVGTQVLNEAEVVALAEKKGLQAYNQQFLMVG